MSAPSPPPDNSVQLRQLELDAAERERQRQAVEDEQRRQELAGLRSGAQEAARGSARQYFEQQGVAADEYAPTIDSVINSILAGIAPDDPNPGSYFSNAGQTAYSQAETGQRNRAMRELDRLFAPNFETQRVESTLDDPILNALYAEQRQSADDIIRNMLNRGVITQTGYDSASSDLERQGAGVRARLDEIGTGQLASGRQQLRDVANNARSTASQLALGTAFDPYSYSSEADRVFTDWLGKLPNSIRAAAPGNLFSTAGLAALAGAGQGAQNTKFDPRALSGQPSEDEEEPRVNESVF